LPTRWQQLRIAGQVFDNGGIAACPVMAILVPYLFAAQSQ